jgi:hypothetical protein
MPTQTELETLWAQKEARKSDYLPFNKLRIFNKSAQTIEVFLEGVDMANVNKPDYIIPSATGMEEDIVQGVNYNLLTVKNAGAVDTVADDILVRMSTARES